MNLFELTENYVKFFTMLEEADEITEELEEMANNLNIAIEEKSDNYVKMIKNLDADVEAYKNQEKQFNKKRKTAENKISWLKKNLQSSMEQTGRKKVKTELFTISIQKNTPALDITSEDNIGDEYYKVERTLNKKDLLKDIKEGLIIDGRYKTNRKFEDTLMSNLILILGQSGTGKSTSIRNMDSEDTFIIQTVNKPLPFKGFKKSYPIMDKDGKGKRLVTDSYDKIIGCLKYLNNNKDIKNIIIDDFQYVISNEFMLRAKEKGFDKFTEMAQHYYVIIDVASRLREDLNIFFLSHNEQKEDGTSKVKTIGKLLDEKITIEGLFTIVLNTVIQDNKYYFQTQNNGFNTTKSPLGMFDEQLIENDLKLVTEKINEYYGG